MSLDIFIPYWGDADYMRQTVDSVLAQRNPDWHLTVLDDAYPSSEVQEYVEGVNDPRITYVKKEINEGITANFRTAIHSAKRVVVAVVGCDDVLLPNYVDVILDAHRAFPEASIIQPGIQVINKAGRPSCTLTDFVKQRLLRPRTSAPQLFGGEQLVTSLLHGDWLYWPSLAFRRDRLQQYDFRDGLPVIQDLALIIDMLLGGEDLLVVPDICFAYRRHAESASVSKLVDGSRFEGEREYFELAARLCRQHGWTSAARAAELRLTSRAHAAVLLPRALLARHPRSAAVLARHALLP